MNRLIPWQQLFHILITLLEAQRDEIIAEIAEKKAELKAVRAEIKKIDTALAKAATEAAHAAVEDKINALLAEGKSMEDILSLLG